MHDYDFDLQAPEDGDVQEDVWQVFVIDNGSIQGDDECLPQESRHVIQYAPEVGRCYIGDVFVHFDRLGRIGAKFTQLQAFFDFLLLISPLGKGQDANASALIV